MMIAVKVYWLVLLSLMAFGLIAVCPLWPDGVTRVGWSMLAAGVFGVVACIPFVAACYLFFL